MASRKSCHANIIYCSISSFYRIAIKYIEAKEKELKGHPAKSEKTSSKEAQEPLSVLEYFLLESGLDKKDIVGIICDTLLAGIDTVSISMCCIFSNKLP